MIDQTGALDLDVEGEKTHVPHSTVMEARRSVMTTATGLAADTSASVELHIKDPAGTRTVSVQADGNITEEATSTPNEQQTPTTEAPISPIAPAPDTERTTTADTKPEPTPEPAPTVAPRASRRASTATPAVTHPATEPPAPKAAPVAVLEPETDTDTDTDTDATQAPEGVVEQAPMAASVEREQVAAVEVAPTRRTSMPSFVDRPDAAAPAQTGIRGLLNHFGFKLAPSGDELSQREDELVVSRHWAGPRTITVLNPKGGAGKTPTVICLSAVFARLGGSGVLAWDNNNSLGSLGWRTFDAGHEATVVDLLGKTDYFMTADARVGDLASYVHHQPADQYDVLRSDDRSGAKARHEVNGAEVHRLYAVAAKYYRLIVKDSGNTERGDNWEAMISHTDQVVIPVKSVDDAAEGASRILSALRAGDEHAQALADRAVVIVLGCTPAHGKAKLNKLADDFRPFVKAVATVPYDPSLVEGRIRFSAMLPATRRAWLRAAALIAEEL
ncbi:chromosome partitioning protein ParA [Arthrobacter sp. RIT-PI-e]|uniref:chromosome partitioning protein ParA n=1 Tax=Arthrobacter sp. RIT-PI-e TaxID=1681197 RepID=UPI001364C6CF|nr:chromosome partitioning protein ParA [Arthrobacter sp. RIT-PI-e]